MQDSNSRTDILEIATCGWPLELLADGQNCESEVLEHLQLMGHPLQWEGAKVSVQLSWREECRVFTEGIPMALSSHLQFCDDNITQYYFPWIYIKRINSHWKTAHLEITKDLFHDFWLESQNTKGWATLVPALSGAKLVRVVRNWGQGEKKLMHSKCHSQWNGPWYGAEWRNVITHSKTLHLAL